VRCFHRIPAGSGEPYKRPREAGFERLSKVLDALVGIRQPAPELLKRIDGDLRIGFNEPQNVPARETVQHRPIDHHLGVHLGHDGLLDIK
jgi:hypothetical protein